MAEFTALNINEFLFLDFNYESHHWKIGKNLMLRLI